MGQINPPNIPNHAQIDVRQQKYMNRRRPGRGRRLAQMLRLQRAAIYRFTSGNVASLGATPCAQKTVSFGSANSHPTSFLSLPR
jgi:hypothetical protein